MAPFERLRTIILDGGLPAPSPEDMAKINEIDAAVEGSDEELANRLQELSTKLSEKLEEMFGQSRGGYRGTTLAPLPENNGQQFTEIALITQEHQRRLDTIRNIVADLFPDVMIIDGGIKSVERALKKEEGYKKRHPANTNDIAHCPDLSRIRLIASGLKEMSSLSYVIKNEMEGYGIIANYNRYSTNFGKKYETPFKGVIWNFCWEDDNKDLTDTMSTEVQLVTARVAAVMSLNHAFDVEQILEYPDQETKDRVNALFCKASILDLQELAASLETPEEK
ncbi:MAG: hypothetical protein WC752_03170 [Patescibacteria group bacterium]|jgi:hypothetical protein